MRDGESPTAPGCIWPTTMRVAPKKNPLSKTLQDNSDTCVVANLSEPMPFPRFSTAMADVALWPPFCEGLGDGLGFGDGFPLYVT
jgi:hypothetical protein